ncbi:MAG: hypothetical protein CK532_07710 [Flavobacteriales bacterium]|nr:MAG: hypothetical protein CK532_07710 [Flavobacteriales bacterium]
MVLLLTQKSDCGTNAKIRKMVFSLAAQSKKDGEPARPQTDYRFKYWLWPGMKGLPFWQFPKE